LFTPVNSITIMYLISSRELSRLMVIIITQLSWLYTYRLLYMNLERFH